MSQSFIEDHFSEGSY